MMAHQKNINIKNRILKVEDNFVESPLVDLYFQFKFSNYYPE